MSEVAVKATLADRMATLMSIADMELAGHKTTAQKIRFLASTQEKEDRGAIAKHLGIRYQWVRNVLITPIKSTAE